MDQAIKIRDVRMEQTRIVKIFLEDAPEVDAIPPFGYDPRFEPPYTVSSCMIKIRWEREKDSDLWLIKNVFAEGWGPDKRVRQAHMIYPERAPAWILTLAGQFQPETEN